MSKPSTSTPIKTDMHFLESRFRCPDAPGTVVVDGTLSENSGYFRFGPNILCYGRCASAIPAESASEALHDAREYMIVKDSTVRLSFDPQEVIDNLRCERYFTKPASGKRPLLANGAVRKLYYAIRPALGVGLRKHIQRFYFRRLDRSAFPTWPVDQTVENIYEQVLIASLQSRGVKKLPFIWFWPDGAKSCCIMTHDVETAAGLAFCPQLMDLNDSFGIKSSFQIIPEKRYAVPRDSLESIRKRGFELNIHDLNHDGHLFHDRQEFMRRAERINHYAREFGAVGFRSAVMYRNVDWYDALHFQYDMSIPNVARLDPQQGGCCTVFPFFVGDMVELPLTTTQDYSLFHILSDYSIQLWREQVSTIREQHGLISFIFHPDYVIDQKARQTYMELLEYISDLRTQGETWIGLPSEVAQWWRTRSKLKLVQAGDSWRIEGMGSERARLAFATVENGELRYQVCGPEHIASKA